MYRFPRYGPTALWLAIRSRHVVVVEASDESSTHIWNNVQLNPALQEKLTLIPGAVGTVGNSTALITNVGSPMDCEILVYRGTSEALALCPRCHQSSSVFLKYPFRIEDLHDILLAFLGEARKKWNVDPLVITYSDASVIVVEWAAAGALECPGFVLLDFFPVPAKGARLSRVPAVEAAEIFAHPMLHDVGLVKVDIEGAEARFLPEVLPIIAAREAVLIVSVHGGLGHPTAGVLALLQTACPSVTDLNGDAVPVADGLHVDVICNFQNSSSSA